MTDSPRPDWLLVMPKTPLSTPRRPKVAIHPSHEMTQWRSTIVTLVATPRFGEIRACKHCGAEQARTGQSHAMHDELRVACTARQS